MSNDPNDTVTDSTEHFHRVRNTFCGDQAMFPRRGSAKPVPTGLTLARLGERRLRIKRRINPSLRQF
jgi:hypothetical protein